MHPIIHKLAEAIQRKGALEDHEAAHAVLHLRPLADGSWHIEHKGDWIRFTNKHPTSVTVWTGGSPRVVSWDEGPDTTSPQLRNIWHAMTPAVRERAG